MRAEHDPELDLLWDEFHTVVNMSSRELREWLLSWSANPDGTLADRGLRADDDTRTGEHVVRILGKRKTDLTEDDLRVMRAVVATVRDERGADPEPVAGARAWRHRLMTLGHDPLKPFASSTRPPG
jgi:hypothetical protein